MTYQNFTGSEFAIFILALLIGVWSSRGVNLLFAVLIIIRQFLKAFRYLTIFFLLNFLEIFFFIVRHDAHLIDEGVLWGVGVDAAVKSAKHMHDLGLNFNSDSVLNRDASKVLKGVFKEGLNLSLVHIESVFF